MRTSCEPRVFEFRRGSEVTLCLSFNHFDNSQVTEYCVVIFAVRYSSNPLSKKCHFGHVGDADPNMIFILQRTASVTMVNQRNDGAGSAMLVC